MHINLIYEEEQRSGSSVSLALMLRVTVGAVAFLMLVGIVSFYSGYRTLQNRVQIGIDTWKETEPKYKEAIRIRSELAIESDVLKEIQGWRTARVAWGEQLEQLQPAIPAVIQLTELRVGQTILLVSNNIPARGFELKIAGHTAAEGSEVNVVRLLDALKAAPFKETIEAATLPPGSFRQDSINKTDRAFDVVCKYFPKPLQ